MAGGAIILCVLRRHGGCSLPRSSCVARFCFFRAAPLDKDALHSALPLVSEGSIIQDSVDTLAVSMMTGSGVVKLSFFGSIGFGRVGDPLQTADGVLLVASLDDLMATKLKAILDRAEVRDYCDIAAMLRHGASLERALGSFRTMFKGEPATMLRALAWFRDGDLSSLSTADRDLLTAARDRVRDVPSVAVGSGNLAVPTGECDEIVAMGAGPLPRN